MYKISEDLLEYISSFEAVWQAVNCASLPCLARRRSRSPHHGCSRARHHGCSPARHHGCSPARHHGCSRARHHGCSRAHHHGCSTARHHGCSRARHHGCSQAEKIRERRHDHCWELESGTDDCLKTWLGSVADGRLFLGRTKPLLDPCHVCCC